MSFLGVAVFRSTYFGLYDTFKEGTANNAERWLLSYISTFAAITLTYPSDTVRRRLMLSTSGSHKYSGFLDCCRLMWRREGFRSFYAGAPVILLQSVSGASIYFMMDRLMRDVEGGVKL